MVAVHAAAGEMNHKEEGQERECNKTKDLHPARHARGSVIYVRVGHDFSSYVSVWSAGAEREVNEPRRRKLPGTSGPRQQQITSCPYSSRSMSPQPSGCRSTGSNNS